MTVKELLSELEDYDGETEVVFAYNYGDYWNTKVCESIRDVREEDCNYSDYHNRYARDQGEADDKTKTFVILS